MHALRQFLLDPGQRKLIFSSAWLLGDRCVRIVLGLAVNVVLARSYGPAIFGAFAYALTLASLVSPVVSIGLERVVIRDLARSPSKAGVIMGSAAGLRFLSGLVGAGAAMALSLVTTGSEGTRLLVVLVVSGNVFLAADVVDWWLQSHEKFPVITLVRGSAFVLGTATKVILALSGHSITWVALVVALEVVLAAGLLFVTIMWARDRPPRWQWSRDATRSLLAGGIPLAAAEIAVCIFQRVDVVMLEKLADAAQVGVYASAQRIAQAAYFVPMIAVQVLSPKVARCENQGEALALIGRAMTLLALGGYFVSVVLGLGSGTLVDVLFGAEFSEAQPVAGILALTNVFVFLGCSHSLYLINRGYPRISFRLAWMTAFVSVAANLVLIPRYAAVGAAVASVIAYGLTTIFGVVFYPASRPLFLLNLRALAGPVLLPLQLLKRRFE